jgi:hypothetical protein
MRKYANFRYNIVEDDHDLIVPSTKTDRFCILLSIVALLVLIAGIAFVASVAKAEAQAYATQANQELCNLMEFNGSTYKCEG